MRPFAWRAPCVKDGSPQTASLSPEHLTIKGSQINPPLPNRRGFFSRGNMEQMELGLEPLEIIIATRYNGIYITGSEIEKLTDEKCDEVQDAIGEIAEYTYDKLRNRLTNEEEAEVIKLAKEKLKPFLGDVEKLKIDYDDQSS